jgi:hypothetical protein
MQSNAIFTKSLGTLRMNNKTKERSPDLTGTIKIHRHLVTALWNELRETGGPVAECNLAAWHYRDKSGHLFNVQLSGKYEPPRQYHGSENIFDLLAKKLEGEVD